MTARKTDINGWFEVKRNPLSRVGVFPYSGRSLGKTGEDADRIFRVYRPEEELSSPECLESFKLIPWVDNHTMLGPNEEAGQTPAEEKGVQGVIGEEIVYDSGVLYGNIKVFSNSLARLIAAGKRQLSAGYRCVYDWTAGAWNGQPYDCVQRAIRGNHLALVQEGRMGPSVAVLDHLTFSFDAQEAIAMADKETPEGGAAGTMTLADALKMLNELAPQVAALTAAVAKLGTPAAAAAPADAKPADAGASPPADGSAAPGAAAAAPVVEDATAKAMDAALEPIRKQLEGFGKTLATVQAAFDGMPQKLVQDVAARDKLASRIAAHVGTFDHADKTLSQVAAYGCEKFGLKPVAGAELVAVEAFLHGKGAPGVTVRHAQDAAPVGENFVTRHLSGQKPAAAK